MKKLIAVLKGAFLLFICMALFGYLVSKAERGAQVKGARHAILTIAHFPDLVRAAILELINYNSSKWLVENPFDYCGPTILDPSFADSNYVLISAFDVKIGQSKIELLSLADSKVVYEWIPPVEEVLENLPDLPALEYHPITKRNFVPNHPLLLPDGAIVFFPDYGPLVKMDKNSKIEWIITDRYFHHSLELDAEGNIWVCANKPESEWDSIFTFRDEVFHENTIVCVSPAGDILYEKSTLDIFFQENLRGMVFGTGVFENDPLHLNDVQPALSTTPFWQKGDLLLSLRNKSLVCLFRPEEDRIVWKKMGNWVNQHDVDFVPPDKIALFGNDIIRLVDEEITMPVSGFSKVYLIDLESGTVSTPFPKVFKESEIYSTFQGRSEILPSGKIFIEEADSGRLLIADEEKVEWAYTKCNKDSEKELSLLAWCRYLCRGNKNFDFINN